MPSNENKHPEGETLLVTVADSIGSTLGAIAANAGAVSGALSDSSFLQTAEREGRKIVRKGKTVAKRIKKSASQNVKSNKLAKATRRGLRRAAIATKRTVRPIPVKKKVAGESGARSKQGYSFILAEG